MLANDAGSSNSASGGSGSEQGGAGGAQGCGESRLESTKRRVNILLVIDRSLSMDASPQGSAAPSEGAGGSGGAAEGAAGSTFVSGASKWELLKAQLVSSLDDIKDELYFGMELFPYSDDLDPTELLCEMPEDPVMQVPVAPGDQALDQITSLLEITPPSGDTPMSAALDNALEYFTTGDGVDIEGDRYVLLATDGGPVCNGELSCEASGCVDNLAGFSCGTTDGGNCCAQDPLHCIDDQATITAIEALAAENIHTFVVGIPGSEIFGEYLDSFAVAGQEPRASGSEGDSRYFKVEAAGNMQGLSQVLRDITGDLVKTCILELDSVPPNPALLNVYIDGVVVPKPGEDGWNLYMSTDPPQVELLGATCERMQTQGAERVSIEYGCPTVELL